MPTRFIYNGHRFIPAPIVTLSKNYQRSADGTKIGSIFSISIQGTQLTYMGSPNSSGIFYDGSSYPTDESVADNKRLSSTIRKQEAIREIFSEDGHQLEWQSADGSAPCRCNPRVLSIEFPADIWYQTFNYVVNLEADIVTVNGVALGEDQFPNYIEDASESWSFETDDERPEGVGLPRTYRLSHSISAKGKKHYDETSTVINEPWQEARAFCLPRLGFDATIALSSGVNNLPSYYSAYNNVRNENIDELGGSYSITETFVLASGTAIEDFSISTRTSLDTGLTTVGVEGNIVGLEVRDGNYNISTFKYDNAVTKFAIVEPLLLTRAQNYSGETLNITPLSTSVGRNPLTGTINYSYEYNTRPSNLISGARSESITIQNSWGQQAFAPIFVLGRTRGPVLQDLSTYRERSRTLNIELVMPIADGNIINRLYTSKPSINPTNAAQIQNIVNSMNPATFGATDVFVADQNESWDGSRYNYTATWVFELPDANSIL